MDSLGKKDPVLIKARKNKSVFPINKLAGRGRMAPDFLAPSWPNDRRIAESRVDETGRSLGVLEYVAEDPYLV